MFDRSRYEPKKLIVASLRSMVRGFDAATVSIADAVALVDWYAEVERLAAAGKTLAAGRAAQGEPWRAAGDRSAADWLAKRTGSTVGDSRGVLDTAANLESTAATDDAFRNGTLSPKQAEAVAAAAAADPGAEQRLLELARGGSLQKLRDEAARVRAAAEPDPKARHERIRRNRFWKRWTDPDGARRGSYSMTPEAAAILEAAAQPFIDAAIDEARRTGDHEPFEANAADGLTAMAASTMTTTASVPRADTSDANDANDATSSPDGNADSAPPATPRGGRGRRRLRNRRELIALVDLEALHRGSTEPGETCEIAGVGPVPVEVVRELFGDALLRIVIRNGVDIRTVVHTGRTANAVQETAVLVRQNGLCERPCCGLPISEIDHITGFTATRRTTLDDLGGLCGHDHDLKTLFGHTYRRLADGTIQWLRPDGTIEEGRPPP